LRCVDRATKPRHRPLDRMQPHVCKEVATVPWGCAFLRSCFSKSLCFSRVPHSSV
jgi:hypothetical protein